MLPVYEICRISVLMNGFNDFFMFRSVLKCFEVKEQCTNFKCWSGHFEMWSVQNLLIRIQ